MQDPKLNILIYPMLSVDNVNGDSNYIIIKNICNELIKTKRYNFYLILDLNRNYVKDDLNKQIKIINVSFPKSKKSQVVHFNATIMKKITNTFAFDMIWNNVVEQGHHLKYMCDQIDASNRIKVFNYHHYPIHRSLKNNAGYYGCYHILLDQLIGSMTVDLNYFHSKHSFNMLIEEAEDVLNKKSVDLIKTKTKIQIGGYVDKLKSKNKYDIYTFIYNHRLDGYKNFKDTFRIFDKLWKQNLKFQVIVTGNDSDNISVINSKPYVVVKSFKKHKDYIEELKKCHANTINSIHETFCISINESILNDQVVVLPNRCTFPELVEENYKYLFETEEDQYKILKHIISNDIKSFNHKNSKSISLKNHIKNIDQMFQNVINYKNDTFKRIKNQTNKNQIIKYLKNKNTIELNTFKNFIFSLGYASQSMPTTKLKKILNDLNFDYSINTNLFHKKL